MTRFEFGLSQRLRRKYAHLLDFVMIGGPHQLDGLTRDQASREDTRVSDYPSIDIEDRIENQRSQFPIRDRFRRRDAMNNRFQDIFDPEPGLRAGQNGLIRRNRQDVFELLLHRWNIGIREIDLVNDRDDRQILFHGEMHVRHRLGFHALSRIHHQHGALTGRQASRYFVGEIDVTRGIKKIQPVGMPIFGQILHRHRVRLDGDSPLPLQIHGVQQLILLIAIFDGAGHFEQSIGQRRLAVIDVRDNAKIASEPASHLDAHYSLVAPRRQRGTYRREKRIGVNGVGAYGRGLAA